MNSFKSGENVRMKISIDALSKIVTNLYQYKIKYAYIDIFQFIFHTYSTKIVFSFMLSFAELFYLLKI